jgi:GAF domain-containing protein
MTRSARPARLASSARPGRVSEIGAILQALLADTGASRVTLRRGVDGDYAFPVTDEALAPGVSSLREERTVDLRTQPVAREVLLRGQVLQDDCRTAYDDPAFQRMLDTYGGLAAQIVTAVVSHGEVAGILSVHQLKTPRRWTEEHASACRLAAEQVAGLL